MTTITAAALRSISSDTFDDLLPPGVSVASIRADGSMLTVTFCAPLPAEVEASIRARMASRDDADQAKRANLADLLANDTTASPLAKAVAAYLLGDS